MIRVVRKKDLKRKTGTCKYVEWGTHNIKKVKKGESRWGKKKNLKMTPAKNWHYEYEDVIKIKQNKKLIHIKSKTIYNQCN